MPSETLFEIAGLQRVWVLADVYESDAPFVVVGQSARMSLSYLPGRTWTGKVTFIAPVLDQATRTVKVRVEFANPDGVLKPEMYSEVLLERPLGRVVAVPESAVLTTGTRSIVFVAKGGGEFEPREVETRREDRLVLPDSRGAGPRRGRRHAGELPRRFRIAPEGGAHRNGPRRREDAGGGAARRTEAGMIERIIAFSARNRFIVLVLTGAAICVGVWSISNIALDALPDLSDTQVIVYSRWDRSPDIIEDQVTYPIITSLLGAPRVKAIRGFSDFGFSYVYVIFDEGTDLYWARSRTLEYLSKIQPRLPEGVRTELGPDATGVGWVFQYALVDETGKQSLADLRSIQDWHIRYDLQSVAGVAEVASVGGFVRQYQVTVDPNRLSAYGVPLMSLVEAIRASNNEVGGRLIEWSGAEYMVRARGYVRSISDLEEIVVKTDEKGTPVRLRDVAQIELGPGVAPGSCGARRPG